MGEVVDLAALRKKDPEPQPEDGPEYHADHAAWESRQSEDADTAAESENPDTPAEGFASLEELAAAVERGEIRGPEIVAVNDLPDLRIMVEAAPDGSCVLLALTTVFGTQIFPLDLKVARALPAYLKEKCALADKHRAAAASAAKKQLAIAEKKLQLPGRDF